MTKTMLVLMVVILSLAVLVAADPPPRSLQSVLASAPKATSPSGATRLLAMEGTTIKQLSYSSVHGTGGGASTDNPTFTTGVNAPLFNSTALDGYHFVECTNSGAMSTTGLTSANAGRFCFDQTLGKFRYWSGTALADLGGGGTWGGITGTLSTQQDLWTQLQLYLLKTTYDADKAALNVRFQNLSTQVRNLRVAVAAVGGNTTGPTLTRITPSPAAGSSFTSNTNSYTIKYTATDSVSGMAETLPLKYQINGGTATGFTSGQDTVLTGFSLNVPSTVLVTATNAIAQQNTDTTTFTYTNTPGVPYTADFNTGADLTGTDGWTKGGTPNWAYNSPALEGAYSLRLPSNATYVHKDVTLATADTVYFTALLYPEGVGDNGSFLYLCSTTNCATPVTQITVSNGTEVRAIPQGGSNYTLSGTGALAANTQKYIKVVHTKATGGGGNATTTVYTSPDGTTWTSQSTCTNGATTAQVTGFTISGIYNSALSVDSIRLSTTDITDAR